MSAGDQDALARAVRRGFGWSWVVVIAVGAAASALDLRLDAILMVGTLGIAVVVIATLVSNVSRGQTDHDR